jgi:uncharacterized protein YlxW (UPF0749 family)
VSRYRVLVPLVAVAAGLLVTTAATTSRGTELRGQRDQLPQLVVAEQRRVADLENQVQALRGEVEARTQAQSGTDARVAAATRDASRLAGPAGLEPVIGPGLTVTLADAPPAARDRPPPPGVPAPKPDDLVVHQQDIQGVVNALWAGGAEAMRVMDQRIVSTSAVRCVGNTLILQGRVYSPPYVITAIGDPARLDLALDSSANVQLFRYYADRYGLVYETRHRSRVRVPGFAGSLDLLYAKAAA